MITPTSFGFGLGSLQSRSIIAVASFLVKVLSCRYFFKLIYLRVWVLWRSLLYCLTLLSFSEYHWDSCLSILSWVMEGIADNMANVLSLTEREAVVHEHIDDVGGGVELGRAFCLVFRVFTTRTVKLEWFEEAMRNAWITRAPITFSEYGNGMFMVEFGCEGDMKRVIEGQPWHFDHSLVTSANPAGLDTLLPNQIRYSPFWIQVHSIPFGMKSYKLAKMIGDEVGDFLEADKMTLLKASGLFLRIRVLLDVSKPIPRGILIDFRNIHKEKWLNFKFENLSNICFHCGMFDHTLTKCVSYLKKCDEFAYPPPLHYKIPLKAPAKSNFKRNPFDLSNSHPLDELPISQSNVDQSLAAAVNQFLTTQDAGADSSSSGAIPGADGAVSSGFVGNNPVPPPEPSTFERQSVAPTFNPGFNCPAPVDAFYIERITEKAKGKAVAGAKRSAFLPHSVMVGDSLRNILKRARAGPVINEASNDADSPFHREFRAFVISLVVKNHRPSLLFVMESKLLAGHCDSFRTRLSFDNAFEVPRCGLSGGLLLFWTNDVNVNILNYSSNHIDCIITFEDNITTHFSCFYGSPYAHDKTHTWTLIDRLFDNAPLLPWLVLGDFNDYLSANDRSSTSNIPHYAMVNFQAFVNKHSLVPIHFVGNKYTWKHGSTYERLDWGIANDKWFHHYPQALLHHLSFYGSDHRVLKVVLSDDSMHRTKNKRFLFENHWLTEPSFYSTVADSWSSSNLDSRSDPISSFLKNQSNCIHAIKNWNKSYTSLSYRINEIDGKLSNLSSSLPASPDQLHEISNLQSHLDSLLYKQEILWKQRSKVHWLRAGDKNTKFFHQKASSRKKTNFIRKLTLDDGTIISTHSAIEAEICRFFSNLFQSQGTSTDAVNLLLSTITSRLTPQQFAFLDGPFTVEEVKSALFQLSGDKAPGSDGLNAYFYQKNWSIVGKDLSDAILSVLNNNASMDSINKTLIVLIPKKHNASALKDYRPISLCTTLYKIVSKTIANRLKSIMEDVISPTQSAFLSDRLIFDNILIAQEMIHAINHRKTGKIGWVGIKLDMEKAFDRVEWNFLSAILNHLNFPSRIITLIHQCLSSVSIKFSINGNISKEILPTRGLRQGDPLSPYLFLLCSEGLAAALNIQKQLGNFDGISIARTAPAVSHLLFADDTLIFAKATYSSCNALQAALQLYNQATGQCVNFGKSSILFSPNTPSQISSHFYQTLGISNGPFMSKVWSHKFFSKAGKEVLLKSVIQAIPSYAMSCYKLPASICHKIEKLMAQFWWGSFGNHSKAHWKSWPSLCQSKFFGGLGFRSLIHHNQALLAKQAWRVLTTPDSIASQILKARYFRQSSFLQASKGHSPSFSWSSLLWGRELLKEGLIWKVGNGQTIRTLQDSWIPDLRSLRFKNNSAPPSDKVSFFIKPNGSWDLNRLAEYFDHDLVACILKVPIGGSNSDDCLIWKGDPSGLLTVKSAYHLSNTSNLPPSSSNTSFYNRWWKFFWHQSIPPKVKNFGWRTFYHILPTAFNLFRRKVVPSPSCSFCGCSLETVTHALLDCSRARQVWKLSPLYHFYILHRHSDVKDLMLSAYTDLTSDDFSLLMCTLWSIWEFRNKKLFRNTNSNAGDVVQWTSAFLSQYKEAQLKRIDMVTTHQANVPTSAIQVKEGSYQLYTDAAIQARNGKIGLGAVVKDWNGQLSLGCQMPMMTNIQLAFRKKDLSAMADVVWDIRNSLSHFPNASVTYTPRNNNIHAHQMAKGALGLDEELVWKNNSPSFLFVT
uniref:Reverse transcriptase domain-containing protein n=1 Tax=Cannabis sativa TaxID=3483 RepID=A0A803PQN1_CANSA